VTSHEYDPAGRLISATSTEPLFDSWFVLSDGGDVIEANTVGTIWTMTQTPGTHQTVQRTAPSRTPETYVFDAAGYVTERTGHQGVTTFTRDARGRPVVVSNHSRSWQRHYDHKGEVAYEHISATPVYRLGAWQRVGTEHRITPMLGAFPLARITRKGRTHSVQSIMVDAQGTRIATTTKNGVVGEIATTPFGQQVSGSGQFDPFTSYTGLARAENFNLIGTALRAYEPDSTLFMGPDPALSSANAVLTLRDPYNMNPYRYARGNPLVFTDRGVDYVESVWDAVARKGACFVAGTEVAGQGRMRPACWCTTAPHEMRRAVYAVVDGV